MDGPQPIEHPTRGFSVRDAGEIGNEAANLYSLGAGIWKMGRTSTNHRTLGRIIRFTESIYSLIARYSATKSD